MSQPPSIAPWDAPQEPAGPAPGISFAPHGDRLLAYLLDTIIVGIFIVIAIVGAAITLGSGISGARENPTVSPFAAGGFTVVFLIVVIVATAYFPWFWARGGATPGMKRFGLRVVDDHNGGPISGGKAVLRLRGRWGSR